MKYLETKHEQNSAKITTLIVIILVLLCFVVGQSYQDPPEEYGVAINFGDGSVVSQNIPTNTNNIQETDNTLEETLEEEVIEEDIIEEEVAEEKITEEIEEQTEEDNQEKEEQLEEESLQKEIEEAAKQAEAEAAEKLLAQQEEEALKIKKEEEVKEALKAKEAKEAKEKQEREASEAKEKAAKAKAKADADKAAKRAEAQAMAKAKAQKAKADKEAAAKAAAAKAAADKAAKDKAAAGTSKSNGDGNKSYAFELIENSPVYPGCESGNNNARKKCMNDKIKQFLGENFNKSLASELGLSGVQRINIFFKIDQNGNVVGIRAKAPDPKLEQEAKRVTNLLPKMKPGMQQGRPVTVSFRLPLNVKAN